MSDLALSSCLLYDRGAHASERSLTIFFTAEGTAHAGYTADLKMMKTEQQASDYKDTKINGYNFDTPNILLLNPPVLTLPEVTKKKKY